MGQLNRFDLKSYIDNFGTTVFIETGTGKGDSLSYAMKYSFKKLYTIEIIEEIFNNTKKKFLNEEKCHFINDNSKNGLKSVLHKIDDNENICYWLDAHFPGADSGLSDYGSFKDDNIRIPLESELREITSIRDFKNDVFIIDDLRIYEDGPYTSGNWNLRHILGGNDINFIFELFDNTHNINRDYRDEGYLIITPKTSLIK